MFVKGKHRENRMDNFIYDQTERLLAWAVPQNGGGDPGPGAVAIGLERDGILKAVVYFTDFSKCDCQMHVVSDGKRDWMSREFIVRCFAYPFVQLGLRRVTAPVPAKNITALNLDLRLGFQVEGRMAEALPDDDIVVLGMLRRNCKWLSEGQRYGW